MENHGRLRGGEKSGLDTHGLPVEIEVQKVGPISNEARDMDEGQ